MIKVLKTFGPWGFEGAVYGMRMPYESWDRSDSGFDSDGNYEIGPKDIELAISLIDGGSEHRKFMRDIHVQIGLKAPRYVWTEIDTYKVGSTRNSSSTMHLITKRLLTMDDFSFEDSVLTPEEIKAEIDRVNSYIIRYNEEKDRKMKKRLFLTIKKILPESFMQLSLLDTNYEVLYRMYHQRKNHKLPEWSGYEGFCRYIERLPYMEELLKLKFPEEDAGGLEGTD